MNITQPRANDHIINYKMFVLLLFLDTECENS